MYCITGHFYKKLFSQLHQNLAEPEDKFVTMLIKLNFSLDIFFMSHLWLQKAELDLHEKTGYLLYYNNSLSQ